MNNENNTPIVLDIGSNTSKIGFSGNTSPRAVFPSIIGRVRQPKLLYGLIGSKQYYVGNQAQKIKDILSMCSPFNDTGDVVKWDLMEMIWEYCWEQELRINPLEHMLIILQPPFSSPKHWEHTAEIMLETFQIPELVMMNNAVLSVYATSNTWTGLVVDSGYNSTRIVPVVKGKAVSDASRSFPISGKHITQRMIELIQERGYSIITPTEERRIANTVKEMFGYVKYRGTEFKSGKSSDSDTEIDIGDGNSIFHLNEELYRCTEIMFHSNDSELCCSEKNRIQEKIMDSILHCENSDIRQYLGENIILSGGNTLFPGFDFRLKEELNLIKNEKLSFEKHLSQMKIEINASPTRQYNAWEGGSIIGSKYREQIKSQIISRNEFHEFGNSIIHSKCIL